MITWIQTVLQKHHKIVFSILLVAIIIAFVFTIGSVPFLGDRYRGSSENDSMFCGYDLSNPNTAGQFQTCAFYDAILNNMPIRTREQFEILMLSQVYMMSVARDLGMRQVSESELKSYIESRPAFAGADGKFDPAIWEKFKSERISTNSISESGLTSILAQNALVNKISNLLGGPGYVVPSEIETDYKRYFGTWDFDVAILSEDAIKVPNASAADLEKYFKDNIEAYRIGEGCEIEAVFFAADEFVKNVPAPSETEISAYYGSNLDKYATIKDGKKSIPLLAEIKDKVKADYLSDTALRNAATRAEDVSAKVYDSGMKANSKEFRDFISSEKLAIKKLPAIRSTDVGVPEGFPAELFKPAMNLDEKLFYTDPVVVRDGVWLGFLVKKLPSYLPKFDEVKARVEEDFQSVQRAKLFAERGSTLSAALQKAVKDGKSFEAAAKAGGASVETANNFSLREPSQNIIPFYNIVRAELLGLKIGEVSKMQTLGGNGYIVYLKKHVAPVVDKNSKEYKDLEKNVEKSFALFLRNSIITSKISAPKEQ